MCNPVQYDSITRKNAYFQNNKWYVVDAKIMNKPIYLDLETSKLEIKYEKFLNTLEGFKPKILDNVYETTDFISSLFFLLFLSYLSFLNVVFF